MKAKLKVRLSKYWLSHEKDRFSTCLFRAVAKAKNPALLGVRALSLLFGVAKERPQTAVKIRAKIIGATKLGRS